uniref:CHK kinase-like domain-containing protein n=1 Tax=Phaeomonas parva TaxID=124430 RepID=A0A7S1XMA0_9STRA|mmetsp:Transcript_16345/g.49944  ORF Transcript_16345/g.49944 Transcript_16345/m.49944 type:complete len:473 (+) Transcript_16345:129-1547(+)
MPVTLADVSVMLKIKRYTWWLRRSKRKRVTKEQVSEPWLRQRLRGSVLEGLEWDSFAIKQIGAEDGSCSTVFRIKLLKGGNGVKSIVLKTSPDSTSEMVLGGCLLRYFQKEVRFLREVSPKLPVRAPACYWSYVDGRTGHFAMLMEDMAPSLCVNALEFDDSDAFIPEAAMVGLAKLHAKYWQDDEFFDAIRSWAPDMSAPLYDIIPYLYRRAWPTFFDSVKSLEREDLYDDSVELLGEVLIDLFPLIRAAEAAGPRTLLHGDAKLANFFFPDRSAAAGAQGVFSMFDWAMVRPGVAGDDLAYFLSRNLRGPTHRTRFESGMIDVYHRTLVEHGVMDVTRSDIIKQITHGIVFCFGFMVVSLARELDATGAERRLIGNILTNNLNMLKEYPCDNYLLELVEAQLAKTKPLLPRKKLRELCGKLRRRNEYARIAIQGGSSSIDLKVVAPALFAEHSDSHCGSTPTSRRVVIAS